MLLPATPGWVSLPVVVGCPRHSWLRAPGAVPRHSWLGSAGGSGVWWGWGWCVVWLVPRHSWRRFLCATPRHSWLGFAAGGGMRLPATPGWGLPVVVMCFAAGGVFCCLCLWCVWVCAVAVLRCVSRVCGVCVVGGVVWWCGGCVFRLCWCVWLRVCDVPVVCGLVSPPLASPGRGRSVGLAGKQHGAAHGAAAWAQRAAAQGRSSVGLFRGAAAWSCAGVQQHGAAQGRSLGLCRGTAWGRAKG